MKVIGTKVPDEIKKEIDILAQNNGVTVSDLIRMCIEDFIRGHYEIRGDHIIPTGEYLDAIRPHDECTDFEDLKFGAVLRLLRRNDYPDMVIKQMNEMQITQISNNGKYNPKRFRDDAC